MVLATGVIGEDGHVKKKGKEGLWMKPQLKNRLRKSAYQNIFQEIHLKDKEGTPTQLKAS